jgi:hypothetical protein
MISGWMLSNIDCLWYYSASPRHGLVETVIGSEALFQRRRSYGTVRQVEDYSCSNVVVVLTAVIG